MESSCATGNNESQITRENITFLYFDPHSSSNHDLIRRLRAINDDVQVYASLADCLNVIQSSNEKIFFISTLNDKALIRQIHDCDTVDGMFIFNPNIQLDKSRFPKLFGIYVHLEELLANLRHSYQWFKETQMDCFSFEDNEIFLWTQLWKDEVIQ